MTSDRRRVRAAGVAAIVGLFWPGIPLMPAAGTTPAEGSARSSIARAAPLLAALEAYKVREGRYPQFLDHLVPQDLRAIPLASGAQEAKSSFVYHGQAQSFELFFLLPPSSDLFLYRSARQYPGRREPGPYQLVKTIGQWGWFRHIPMRNAVVLRQWKGQLPLGKDPHRFTHAADAKTLQRLWAGWEIGEPMPEIDFERQIVLAAIVRSGLVMFKGPVIDDRGDLKRNVVATPDAPSFWSYVVCVVEREGIRSVEGEPL